ncbi:MAG TPA: SPFH domain-containing protein, partial [Burkholderiaceae bacterium]
ANGHGGASAVPKVEMQMDPRQKSQGTHDETPIGTANGFLILFLALGLLAVGGWMLANSLIGGMRWGGFVLAIVVMIVAIFMLAGLYTLQPNEAAILQLFGAYRGTSRVPGLRATNPFYTRKKLSLRARNLMGDKLKVNDKRGNPIEIAAAVVWKVEDAARALFDVEDYQVFVRVQAEAALRHVATQFHYDAGGDEHSDELTLMHGGQQLLDMLRETLQSRVAGAGIVVHEARLTHLAYASEIAGAMLRRQQAAAVIAARRMIVEGAVSMVELALTGLSERGLVDLDDDKKAAMVSNLLVVLCADKEVSPVVNTGTLYH